MKNRKFKGIVAGAVLRAREIPDNYIFIYPDEKDVALKNSQLPKFHLHSEFNKQ